MPDAIAARHVLARRSAPLIVVILALGAPGEAPAIFDVPNDDSGCPASCRRITWMAGADQFNAGSTPIYAPAVTCVGLVEGDGTTDNAPAINACINDASTSKPGTAVYIPPGIYYVNGAITLKSNVVLRGAGAPPPWLGEAGAQSPDTTILKLGPGGYVQMGATSRPSFGTEKAILGGYTKGSTSLTMASGHGLVKGDWIAIFEDGDPAIPTSIDGIEGSCTWCGEQGTHLIQQFAQVTSVAGDAVTISRPLYYTYKSAQNPGVKTVTFAIKNAGIEHIKLDGWSADRTQAFIKMIGALFCWVKGVETYNAPSGADKANHVRLDYSHGCEVRDSYLHKGRDNSSDRNYGISLFFWNSDHKIENNILREHRHSLSFEGGGAGCAVLYNYIDDNYTDDRGTLAAANANHGAHPYMNLYEGNIVSHLIADNIWGSSSHNVYFRNWLWGDETGRGVPSYPPSWAYSYTPLDICGNQSYYSVIGNVLGISPRPEPASSKPAWSSYVLRATSSSCAAEDNAVYNYGCDIPWGGSQFVASSGATSLNHGNYDYKTSSVAYWEGGSDHTLADSMYYGGRPAFFGERSWPPIGFDRTPMTGTIPARDCYEGNCGGVNVRGDAGVPDAADDRDARAQDASIRDARDRDAPGAPDVPSDGDASSARDAPGARDVPSDGDAPSARDAPGDLGRSGDRDGATADGAVEPSRSAARGCSCSLTSTAQAPGWVWLVAGLALFHRRARHTCRRR